MISVIICSVNREFAENLTQNISKTIGVEHETIVFDNSNTSYGICKVYNLCAGKAKYDYLCFVHEDVIFHTDNWGQELIQNTQENTGVIGIAGGQTRSVYPVSWGDAGHKFTRMNVLQRKTEVLVQDYKNPDNENYSRVLLLDGVFLFTRKKVLKEFRFDEETFSRFHLYDQDFSFNVAHKYINYVCYTVDIEHFSMGGFTNEWYQQCLLFVNKWKAELPKSVIEMTDQEKRVSYRHALYFLIKYYLIENNLPNKTIRIYLSEFLRKYFFSNQTCTLLIKYLQKQFRG